MSASSYRLFAEPLSSAAFASFGDVIETSGRSSFAINQGWAARFHDLATVDVADREGRVSVDLVTAQPESMPLPLRLMERHPLGSQIFMPLAERRYIVVVAAAGEAPRADALRAFVAGPQQGVNYHKGVWHHPIIALDEVTTFITVEREGPGCNLEEADIAGGPVRLALA